MLSTRIRLDIIYSVNFCSRYIEEPTEERIKDVKHILKYLNGNRDLEITYKSGDGTKLLETYCDAGDANTRKSTSEYVIFFAGGSIS